MAKRNMHLPSVMKSNKVADKYMVQGHPRSTWSKVKDGLKVAIPIATVLVMIGAIAARILLCCSEDSPDSQLSTTSPLPDFNVTVNVTVSTLPASTWSTSTTQFPSTSSLLTTILLTSEETEISTSNITGTSTYPTELTTETYTSNITGTSPYPTELTTESYTSNITGTSPYRPELTTETYTSNITGTSTFPTKLTTESYTVNITDAETSPYPTELISDSYTSNITDTEASTYPTELTTESYTSNVTDTETPLYTTIQTDISTDAETETSQPDISTTSVVSDTSNTQSVAELTTPTDTTVSEADITTVELTTEVTQERQTTKSITTEETTSETPDEFTTEGTSPTDVTTQGPDDSWPYTFGSNLDLGNHLADDGFRKGQASDSHSCEHVREVPENLRSTEEMYTGIADFYQKYTEAYGIPVLGSINVTEEGLRRACYVVRFMLASRYDIRNAIYKFYIRVALIGDEEETTSLWEYRNFDSDYWDKRARGLGATLQIPLASAGDDNCRCKLGNRYPTSDILVHEFAHGIHQFGATFTVPRFEIRLKELYDKAKAEGRYNNTYMGSNRNEYWAVGSEIYMESLEGNGYKYMINGTEVALRDSDTLALYDPGLVELMREVYPCPNKLRNACQFKRSPDCGLSNYKLLYAEMYKVQPSCPPDRVYTGLTAEQCVTRACHRERKVFAFKSNGRCVTYKCEPTSLGFRVGRSGYDIYALDGDFHAVAYKESEEEIQQLCTRYIDIPGRCEVQESERLQCGPEVQSSAQCEARGCCYHNNHCFYSKTSECTNKNVYCPGQAADEGRCEINARKRYMARRCAMSCDAGACESFQNQR